MGKVLLALFCAGVLFMAGCRKKAREEILPITLSPQTAVQDEGKGITAVAFSTDGEYLLTASADGYLRIWEVYTGSQVTLLETGGTVRAAAFSPDSGEIAVGLAGGGIQIWNTLTDQQKLVIQTETSPAALLYSQSGQEVAVMMENGELLYWTNTGDPLHAPFSEGVISGETACAALADGYILYAQEKTVILAGMNGREIRRFPELSGAVTALALDPKGNLAAAACADGTIVTWDRNGGGEFRSIRGGGAASALTLNGERAKLFSGHGDGVTRMWNLESGSELVQYIGFDHGEWISIIPNTGYYRGSLEGSRMMNIQVGDKTYSLDQLSELLNRPDKVYAAATGAEQKPAASLAERMKNQPPLVEFLGSGQLSASGPETVLRVKISTRGGGAGHIILYRNQGEKNIIRGLRKISETQETAPVHAAGETVYTVALKVPLTPGNNRIGVSVFNETEELKSPVIYADILNEWQEGPTGKPVLHVLLTAIQSYKNRSYDLKYTVKDAEALEELFEFQKKGNLYSKVVTHKYVDAQVTKENILKIFSDLQSKIAVDDYFVFFFSGHGDVDESGNFYFYPWDTSGPGAAPDSYITKLDLLEGIANIQASNALILLDACKSGQMLAMQTAFDKLLEEMGQKAILTAALGDQSAIETDVFEHGVFTQSILDGINGGIREGDPRHIGIKQLINFVRADVPAKMRSLNSRTETAAPRLSMRLLKTDRKPPAPDAPMQEPLGFYPDDANFNLIDRYLEPGELTVTSVSAGTVMILETEIDNLPIKAGGSLVIKDLPENTYQVLIIYPDKETETQTILLENEGKQTVSFTHRLQERPSYRGFVFIEGGTFTMGSPVSERGRINDETQHQVTLNSFYMSTHEISQREYAAVMGTNPSAARGDNLPVEQVSWFDAVNYCNRRSQNEGLTPAYTVRGVRVTWNRNANGYRLPTEAEWEYACRAGTRSPFNTGNSINSSLAAYTSSNSRPVGQFRPNNWGLYDMHGNVWEWCWDWYGDYTGERQNPAGPASGVNRVSRGGGWYNDQDLLRSAYRGSDKPDDRVNNVGFRVVRPVNQ